MYKIIKGEFRKGRVEGRAVFSFFIYLFIYYFYSATAGIRA